MKKISVVINTKNAALTLENCLQSVQFADEIVVVDMHSTDRTKEIAKKYANQVLDHEDIGYADPARDWSINQASHDWILVIDADEEVSSVLQTKIKQLIEQDSPADVYYFPRQNMIFGEWIKAAGWWPDHQPRLFRKGFVSWKVGVHRMPDVKGQVVRLPATKDNSLTHHNYLTVEDFVDRMNRYTSLQAKERQAPENRFNSGELVKRTVREFLDRGFAKSGYQLGLHGISLALLQGFYEASIYLKQWQLAGFPSEPLTGGELVKALTQLKKELNYWVADYQVRQTSGIKQFYWRVRRKLKS
ncbi:MAG: glycosyltransferase [Candidatus Pacebacteria bacterium]|nr:glycosyltransferase [Candidatus Paceibacterota bacterium]